MSLVELPSNDGKLIAVNPHHVTSCRVYTGTLAGRTVPVEMTVLTVDNHTVYICSWPIEHTLEALNAAKRDDFIAFEAGYHAAIRHAARGHEDMSSDTRAAFLAWQAVSVE